MKQKVVIGLLCAAIIGGTGFISYKLILKNTSTIEENKNEHIYPSMDMSSEDINSLAYAVANTIGNEESKKATVYYILDEIWWNNPSHLSITEFVDRNFNGYFKATENDYNLIQEIILNNGALLEEVQRNK